jgi:hypothetical protein
LPFGSHLLDCLSPGSLVQSGARAEVPQDGLHGDASALGDLVERAVGSRALVIQVDRRLDDSAAGSPRGIGSRPHHVFPPRAHFVLV